MERLDALGMGDDDAEATFGEVVDKPVEERRRAEIGRLEQEVAPAAEYTRAHLLLVEVLQLRPGDLGAGVDAQRETVRVERGLHLRHPLREPTRIVRERRADMWGRHDRFDPALRDGLSSFFQSFSVNPGCAQSPMHDIRDL